MVLRGKGRTLTPDEAAIIIKVFPKDIIELIENGKIPASKNDKGEYTITQKDLYQFAWKMPEGLRIKMGEYLFSNMKAVLPGVQREVNKRFKQSADITLDRAEIAVQLLEKLHKKYEKTMDILKTKNGEVAAFIVYARVISLLYSIINLLRSSVAAESMILYRPLWEAILLVQYFTISMHNNENEGVIKRWFYKNDSPGAAIVRKYLADKMNKPVKNMQEVHHEFSKPVHHSYNAIMQSYKAYQMSGFLGDHCEKFGFDYRKSSLMRDIVSLLFSFEPLLLNALGTFRFSFLKLLTSHNEDLISIDNEINFYKMDFEQRFDTILKERKFNKDSQ